MSKSAWAYEMVRDDFVFIVDMDIGISVTNDAEAVVEEINDSYPERRIFYRDTDGEIAELMHIVGVFGGYGMNPETWPEEIKAKVRA